jgi:hypothetical protein
MAIFPSSTLNSEHGKDQKKEQVINFTVQHLPQKYDSYSATQEFSASTEHDLPLTCSQTHFLTFPALYLGGPRLKSWSWQLAMLKIFCGFPQSLQENARTLP